MSSVARLPSTPSGGDGGVPGADIYRTAVEEYRFQATYNWSRTQYLLGLNAAVLAVAVGLDERASALVFVFGIVAACLSTIVVRTQHGYYRAARNHMTRVEETLGVPLEQRLDTTSTLGKRSRWLSVNEVVYILLGFLAAADAVGAVLALVN